MKLETLAKAWNEKTTGTIFVDAYQPSAFQVSYKDGGKCYAHKCKSVYKLAEKLGMIPLQKHDLENWNAYTESAEIITALESGKTIMTTSPIVDTVRYMLQQKYNNTDKQVTLITTTNEYKDEWDRIIIETTYHTYGLFNDYNEAYEWKKQFNK